MNNDLIAQKSWWSQNWKWLVPLNAVILIFITIFFSSGMAGISADLAQAYSDEALYENALEMAKDDEKVLQVLGEIQPIDKLAILEGQVEYSKNSEMVNTSIRILGTKGKAKMDISAVRINDNWDYKKINIRITSPKENRQTIEIISE